MSTGRDSAADYATVSINHRFECRFPDVWAAVTSPKTISAWFTTCTLDDDGRYSLQFTGDSGEPYLKHASVLGCRRAETFGEYRFILQDEGYQDSTVEVRVSAEGRTACTLALRHLHPPPELVDGYTQGWADYLDSLQRHLAASPPGPVTTPGGRT
jgi:uncharacterized protein YndB with AHSA1/START domain